MACEFPDGLGPSKHRVMGVRSMYRVIAVLVCGFTVAACSSSWMPGFDLSMPSFGGGGGGVASLSVESDPPGAQASASGVSCVTPCRLNVPVNGPFSVNVALNGYMAQSVPVGVVERDDPRLASEQSEAGAVRLDPNPVYVELQQAAPPTPPPTHKTHKKKPKPPATVAPQTPPAAAQAPAPGAPRT